MWRAALSEAQILADMEGTLTGDEGVRAASWRFNEPAGAAVLDDWPEAHHGTLGMWGIEETRPTRLVGLARPIQVLASPYDADSDLVYLQVDAEEPLEVDDHEDSPDIPDGPEGPDGPDGPRGPRVYLD